MKFFIVNLYLCIVGFEMEISPDSFMGTRVRAIKEQVSRMADAYAGNLHKSAEACEVSGVIFAHLVATCS